MPDFSSAPRTTSRSQAQPVLKKNEEVFRVKLDSGLIAAAICMTSAYERAWRDQVERSIRLDYDAVEAKAEELFLMAERLFVQMMERNDHA